eukprot:IDg11536t1
MRIRSGCGKSSSGEFAACVGKRRVLIDAEERARTRAASKRAVRCGVAWARLGRRGSGDGGGGGLRGKHGFDLGYIGAHNLVNYFAILEDNKGRHRRHFELLRQIVAFVDIHLDELDLAGHLLGHLL